MACGDAFISEVMYVTSNISKDLMWYMDSGASDHMTRHKEWFKSYTAFDKAQDVRIADGSVLRAYGKGVIPVEAYDGNAWNIKYLTNVLYVPDIKLNLFSSNVCLDKGYVLTAHGNNCSFEHQGKVCLVGARGDSKLFKLLLKVMFHSAANIAAANTAITPEPLQLWHERLCHQNKDHVKRVLKHYDIPFKDTEHFCEPCVLGKQHRMPFNRSSNTH